MTPNGNVLPYAVRGGSLPLAAILLLALLLGGCAPNPSGPSGPPPGPLDVNFILQAHEVVENPEEDGISYLVVYINGEYVGETRTAAKSVDKFWNPKICDNFSVSGNSET